MSKVTAYNNNELLPLISYKCIAYLLDNNELIWKLLKDKTADAWKIPNLTKQEKKKLIFNGQGDMNDYNVFMDDFNDDVINTETTILRIFPMHTIPGNHLIFSEDIGMSVYTHTNCNHLSNYETRVDRIIQQLTETFSNADINGLGTLVYSKERSNACQTTIIGRIPYKGKLIVFNLLSGTVKDDGC
jgi:hypothetical protein